MFFILCILIFIVAYEDIRSQKIHLWVLLVLIVYAGFYGFFYERYYTIKLWFIFLNLLFVIINLSFIFFYFKILKKIKTSFFSLLGEGDLLFWCVPILLFSTKHFIIYWISSLLFSLILHVIFDKLYKNKESRIPLAGYQSLLLILYMYLT